MSETTSSVWGLPDERHGWVPARRRDHSWLGDEPAPRWSYLLLPGRLIEPGDAVLAVLVEVSRAEFELAGTTVQAVDSMLAYGDRLLIEHEVVRDILREILREFA